MIGLLGDSSSPVNLSILYQYGAVGLIATLGLVSAWVLYKRLSDTHDREMTRLEDQLKAETERADRMERALAELNVTVRTQVLTALAEAQRAVTDAISRMRRDR